MMTQAQMEEGMAYAEDNFQNEHAQHLHMDKQLIRQLFDLRGKKVLDFGCGMGGMTLWYATHWPCEVHGVDIDRHHIAIAQQLQAKHQVQNVRFEQRNILADPLTGLYDLIFMNDVAEHIPYPVLTDILAQFTKLLAPGGKVFLTFPPWAGPFSSHLYHRIRIPWSQFLPKRILLPMIERVNHPLVGVDESDLKSAWFGLNRLTYRKLDKVRQATGLQLEKRRSHCLLNRWPLLRSIPFHATPFYFLVSKEFVTLTGEGMEQVPVRVNKKAGKKLERAEERLKRV